MMDIWSKYRMLKEEFPPFNPKDIEGWDKMNKDDQEAVKNFYNAMKELATAFDQLDWDLEGIQKNQKLWRLLAVDKVDSKPDH